MTGWKRKGLKITILITNHIEIFHLRCFSNFSTGRSAEKLLLTL